MQHGYEYALYALTLLILLTGEGRMKRTVLTILAVMFAAWGLAGLWPSVPYAWAMIAVDSLACIVICTHQAGKWQSAIGLSYIVQVIVHISRIILGDNCDMFGYYYGLSITAILQLLLLGGWWTTGIARRLGWIVDRPLAVTTCDASLVK